MAQYILENEGYANIQKLSTAGTIVNYKAEKEGKIYVINLTLPIISAKEIGEVPKVETQSKRKTKDA